MSDAPPLAAADAALLAEAEFIQALAQPAFLQHLARTRALADAAFVARLGALHARWSAPGAAAALHFPMALAFLAAAAGSAAFRAACADDAFIAALREAQFAHWNGGSPLGA